MVELLYEVSRWIAVSVGNVLAVDKYLTGIYYALLFGCCINVGVICFESFTKQKVQECKVVRHEGFRKWLQHTIMFIRCFTAWVYVFVLYFTRSSVDENSLMPLIFVIMMIIFPFFLFMAKRVYKAVLMFFWKVGDALGFHAPEFLLVAFDGMEQADFSGYLCCCLEMDEYICLEHFQTSGEWECDCLLMRKNGRTFAFWIKHTSQRIGVDDVEAILSCFAEYEEYEEYKVDDTILITNGYCTQKAINLAEKFDMEIWEREKCVEFFCDK